MQIVFLQILFVPQEVLLTIGAIFLQLDKKPMPSDFKDKWKFPEDSDSGDSDDENSQPAPKKSRTSKKQIMDQSVDDSSIEEVLYITV